MKTCPRARFANITRLLTLFSSGSHASLSVDRLGSCRYIFIQQPGHLVACPCLGWKSVKNRRTSDGNLVNVGNFDADGANVNNWKPDNSNSNLGVSFSRSLDPALTLGVFLYRWFSVRYLSTHRAFVRFRLVPRRVLNNVVRLSRGRRETGE